MPTVDENRSEWDRTYDWVQSGEEWSVHWGGVSTQWHATLLPRIWPFVPTKTICEIAPGYGRWSEYLIGLCEQYVGVDLAPACVDACRSRFSAAANATFAVNDGRSLPMLADASVDFAFSFDSLVHVEADVLGSYLVELERVLAPEGLAFLHHSNLGEFERDLGHARNARRLAARVPRLKPWLRRRDLIDWEHWRARSMTAERFAEMASSAHLGCVGQEVITWAGSRLIDCISLVARPTSKWYRPNVVARNRHFLDEGLSARRVSTVFTSIAELQHDRTVKPDSSP